MSLSFSLFLSLSLYSYASVFLPVLLLLMLSSF